jgi:uncharacterized membrane protein
MSPANNPPKPKEKVNEVSLNIAQKLFEVSTFAIAYCLLRRVIEKYRRERARKSENSQSLRMELIDFNDCLGVLC